jgi:hypothetical protein
VPRSVYSPASLGNDLIGYRGSDLPRTEGTKVLGLSLKEQIQITNQHGENSNYHTTVLLLGWKMEI